MSIYDIQVKTITGDNQLLADFHGKVLLIVNTASKCGLTGQYEHLEALYKAKAADGLEILGFPCNQFLGQEPGDEAEIQQFCSMNYGVTFPMFAKIDVNGEHRHPLYKALVLSQPEAIAAADGKLKAKLIELGQAPKHDEDILWNFEKFLVGKDGTVLARFAPDVTVTSEVFLTALNKALA
ncbi:MULTISPECIES: glutathione peroxidase [Shewanella]|jgi:glutathione peroxidase|uniref:glutathione peroxidase n=1 Tax=Shewanella TaxID=22 RepID=UPI001674521E|nr:MULTISPECIES: glutathione peroxidase [Shewanella]MBO1270934.1 glutathione peroxidase [Shewanella sp. 4t3-1-2LB]MCL2906977.1 glutathione peroxidase [Shewanella fodinae]GGZ05919.1 thioredoxin/glutathione peroxidase BtuE [Shewanella fodinae]